MAIYATKGNISQAEFQIAKTKELEEKRIAELQEVCNKLNKVTLKYELQASEEDKLFGSVTPQMVSEQLLENGFNVEKKDIAISDPIKSIGSHYVDIFLHKDVVAKVKVKVKALSV
mgnify:FL=1